MSRRGPLQRFYRSVPPLHRAIRFIKNAATYWLARFAIWFVSLLPLERALALGDHVGALLYYLLREPRRLALEHLELAFGDRLSPAQRQDIAQAAFQNSARSFCEAAKLDAIRPHFDQYVTVEGWEHAEAISAGNRGAIVVTGHIGNWELLAAYFAHKGFPVTAIANRIHSRSLNSLVVEFRARHGVRTIVRRSHSSAREIVRVLRRRGILAMLVDQDVKRTPSVSVPFFGRKARTPVAAASLAIRLNIPLVAVFSQRQPDGGQRLRILPPLPHPHSGDRHHDVIELTRRINQTVEDQILSHPDQWVWWHKRWRRSPVARLDLDPEFP
jgi:Kdo2-lipid IVA lauroyltransferase/acyltransferase